MATLTEMAMGYFRSRVLAATARLGVADALGDGEHSLEELAAACQADAASFYRLLRAAASFGVVSETRPGHFVLTDFGSPLRKDDPKSEWASVVFWGELIADNWSFLTECVRAGARPENVANRWTQTPDASEIFRAVFGTPRVENFLPIVEAYDFSGHETIADLGGAGGGLIAAVLQTYPNARGMLVDRPESIERAASNFVGKRCRLVAADLREAVPAGADVYMMKHVLHGYNDDAAVEILRHCGAVLPKDGRVLVIEFVLPDVVNCEDPQLEGRLMSDLNMLTVTGGKERSALEWKTLLASAGFECLAIIPVPGDLVSVVEARQHGS